MDPSPERENRAPVAGGPGVDPSGAAFRTLAEHVPVGVVLLNGRGEPVHANPAARLLLCGPHPPDDGSVHSLPLPDAARNGAPGAAATEFEVALPDEPPRRIRATRIELAGAGHEASGAILLLEDTAGSVAARTSLELAGRLRSWPLYRIVHNLKQPLNVLSLQLELLKQTGISDEGGLSIEQHVSKAQNEVLRFGRELDHLATLLTPGLPSAPEPFDVGELLAELARRLASALQVARVRMETRLPETTLRANATRARVQQALVAAIQNAIEASPRGGTLRVSARAGDGAVVVEVEDEGPGVPPAVLARAFAPHYSTRPDGTGIGLTVARALLEAEGGSIELANRTSGGTTARISIPNG